MSKVWFTSDLHFGHRNIIDYCPNRPWKTIEEHDAGLLAEWQAKIGPDDEVYFLGDLTLDPDPERCLLLLEQLPGRIHVVLGNHDRALKRVRRIQLHSPDAETKGLPLKAIQEITLAWRYRHVLPRIVFLPRSERVEDFFRFKRDGVSCVLSHHPLEDWPGMAWHGRGPRPADPLSGRWHLHGHSHAAGRQIPARLDVGWDTENAILSWERVLEIMREREADRTA